MEFEIMEVTVCSCQAVDSLSNKLNSVEQTKPEMFQVIFYIERDT